MTAVQHNPFKELRRKALTPVNEEFTSKHGLYSKVDIPDHEREIIVRLINKFFDNVQVASDTHITVVYSDKNPISFEKALELIGNDTEGYPYECILGELEVVVGHDNASYLIMNVTSDQLVRLNKKWVDIGFTPKTFPEYKPHITIHHPLLKLCLVRHCQSHR